MIRFFWDYYMYSHFPHVMVTVLCAACVCGMFLCIHWFGWMYGFLGVLFMMLLWEKGGQGSIITATSRQSYGGAWGIIVTLGTSTLAFSTPHVDMIWTTVSVALLTVIGYTLYLSRTTPAAALPLCHPDDW